MTRNSADNDPVAGLAKLLKLAAPLAELVNSDECSDEDRDRLRALVGRASYVELAVNLSQMKAAATPCCCQALRDPRPGHRNVATPIAADSKSAPAAHR